jgi:hypothetical protein
VKNYYLLLFTVLYSFNLYAQEDESNFKKKLEQIEIKPVLAVQLWSSYTLGEEVYNETTDSYETVDNRLNFQVRRTRLGFKGSISDNLKFNLVSAIDLVGRDLLAGTEAGGNNGASPQLRLWNAYLQWRIKPEDERFNLIAGYFVPQIGRESITPALRSTSMEKSWSQNYLRRHLVGTGPGRAVGVNLGGFLKSSHLIYNIGIFNPSFNAYGGNSVGHAYAPLIVGRLGFFIGDPESDKYTIGHKVNYFGKRQGLSLAIAGAHQGATDFFQSNQALSADFLLNLGALNLDGEWSLLRREGHQFENNQTNSFFVSSKTGYLRLSYNLSVNQGQVLEPVLMYMFFDGEMEEDGQEKAALVGEFAGKETKFNFGLNWYVNPDLKMSFFYTLRTGEAGTNENGTKINNYFYQPGIGPIHRGNWLGLGLVAII